MMAHDDAREGKWRGNWRMEYPSHYLGTWCIEHYYRWCAHLGCQYSTELTPPPPFKWTRPFRQRENLVTPRVPSHFKRSLQCAITFQTQSTVCHHISNAVYNMAVQSQTCVNSEPTCHLLQTDGRCSMDLFLGSKVASPNYLLHPTYLCLQFTIITHILLFLVLTVLKPNS